MSQTSPHKQRDPLLDLWRGLALVNMAWVHLATYPIGMAAVLAVWIGDYTRFAAGAFVFISGLSVARVFGPKLVGEAATVRGTHRRLLQRALMLAVLDRLVAVLFTLIERSLSVPPGVAPSYPDLVGLLTFAEPGATGGLLSLYAILLAATPLLDWGRRRLGSVWVLAASLGLFTLAHLGMLGTPSGVWPFPVAYWQPLFVAGYLASHHLGALRDDAGRIAWQWLALVSGAFGILFLLRNWVALGLVPTTALAPGAFVKVPLSPGELAWYLAVSAFVLTWSAWAWERAPKIRKGLAWLPLLGRQSLLVYVAHLFVQLALIESLTLLDPSPGARALMLPLMAVILVAVAMAGEGLRKRRIPGAPPSPLGTTPLRVPESTLVGSGVIAGALCAVIALQLLLGPPAAWDLESNALAGLDQALGVETVAEGGAPYADEADLPGEQGEDRYPWSPLPAEELDPSELVSDS